MTYLLPGPEQEQNLESHQVAIGSPFFPYYIHIMGWQKTFTLSQRSKGCHLITDEVYTQIAPGIKDVKVGLSFAQLLCRSNAQITSCTGWDALPLHVSIVQQYSGRSCSNAASQHTSAALTINENCDRGPSLSVKLRQSRVITHPVRSFRRSQRRDITKLIENGVG